MYTGILFQNETKMTYIISALYLLQPTKSGFDLDQTYLFGFIFNIALLIAECIACMSAWLQVSQPC